MLPGLLSRVICPTCRSEAAELAVHDFADRQDGHVVDGIVTCPGCGAWYPVEDTLLELVPAPLLEFEAITHFWQRHAAALEALGLKVPEPVSTEAYDAQLRQRELFDAYADHASEAHTDYANTPFWKAVDDRTYRRWKAGMAKDGWLLDLGCANGRSSFPLVDRFTVVGFDISKKMIRKAIERARAEGCMATLTFFVGDGGALPIRPRSFDYVQTYGVLHHLPNPDRAVREIQGLLKVGGAHLASENNKSVFRGLFDALMRLSPLWVEEAGAEPLISRAMLEEWCAGLPVRIECETSVFLPPHLFNLTGRLALPLLDAIDGVLERIPGFQGNGGLTIAKIVKLSG